jgi:hypothetical protein
MQRGAPVIMRECSHILRSGETAKILSINIFRHLILTCSPCDGRTSSQPMARSAPAVRCSLNIIGSVASARRKRHSQSLFSYVARGYGWVLRSQHGPPERLIIVVGHSIENRHTTATEVVERGFHRDRRPDQNPTWAFHRRRETHDEQYCRWHAQEGRVMPLIATSAGTRTSETSSEDSTNGRVLEQLASSAWLVGPS